MLNLLEDLQDELRPDLHLHRARPRRRPPRVRPDRGDVPRQARRVSPAEELYTRPIMPYTEALLSAVPDPGSRPRRQARADRARGRRAEPDPSAVAAAASIRAAATRPRSAQQVEPPLVDYGNGHLAACHHPLNVDEATLEQRAGLAARTRPDRRRVRPAAGAWQRTGWPVPSSAIPERVSPVALKRARPRRPIVAARGRC